MTNVARTNTANVGASTPLGKALQKAAEARNTARPDVMKGLMAGDPERVT